MSQLQLSGYQGLLKGISSLLAGLSQQARAVYTLLVQKLKRTWLALALAGVGGVQVTCTGGELDSDYSTLNRALTQRALQSNFFDIALVGERTASAIRSLREQLANFGRGFQT